MADEARKLEARGEPMSKRLDRVVKKAGSLSSQQRAAALANAGVIKKRDVRKVAQRLRANPKR